MEFGKKLKGTGRLTKKKKLDAGQDVHSDEDVIVPANSSVIISTGIYLQLPHGHVGLLHSRSGLSVKHKLEVGAGCIDQNYRGEIKVHLYNHGDEDYSVSKGDRIAQLLTLPINLGAFVEVDSLDEDKERGASGFGSSGN